VFELRGPLFFGAASRLNDAFEAAFPSPRAYILRFRDVPLADASGVGALARFLKRCAQHGTHVVLSEMNPSVRTVLAQMGVVGTNGLDDAPDYETALAIARQIVGAAPEGEDREP
jgi:SulP family sulfate permease